MTNAVYSVTHVITSLDVGGAEMMLYKLLATLDPRRVRSTVISLADIGPIGRRIQDLGIEVHAAGMRNGRLPSPAALLRIARLLRRTRPDVVQTWMYHADLIGSSVARLSGRTPIVWNIQATDPASRSAWMALRACALMSSRVPAAIVSCSEASRVIHARRGYDDRRFIVIPNGADLEQFRPDEKARADIRAELGVGESTPLVGLIARFHPMKDHQTFVRAAALVHRSRPDAQFVLCGKDVQWSNSALTAWVDEAGLRDRVHLLGLRDDVARICAALDVATLTSSYGEGFPNMIGEAMAAGTPCVVTDVGDSGAIAGDTGRVAPIGDAAAIADGIIDLLSLDNTSRHALRLRARQRIEENFSLASAVRQYDALYARLASSRSPQHVAAHETARELR